MNVNKVSVTMGCILVLAGLVWLMPKQKAQAASANRGNELPTWARIDRAARNLNGGDEQPIRALLNEILIGSGIDQRISAPTASVKDRLVAAEISYQQGKTTGISPSNVVTAVNQLAQKFHAPAYAYTNEKEVSKFRLRMLTLYPNLVGRGAAATRDDSAPHFERSMSPMEAFYTSTLLIYQKLFNADFQLTPQETQSLTKTHLNSTQGTVNLQRTREMLDVIRRGSASMSFRDILNQSEQSLDSLGIPR
jgi:hypothetical protein